MDLTTLIQILQVVGYVIVATIFIVMIKADVKVIKVQMDGITSNINILNNSFSKVSEVLTRIAVQDQRMLNVEEDIKELKHGKGFVGINGEWGKGGKIS